MANYIFESHNKDLELKRLQRIEFAFDSMSIDSLEKAGIRPGSHCLELGAGAGSLLKWMGQKVGFKGRVTGIDKNAQYISHLSNSPYTVIESDFLECEINDLYDVVHCRYVLIHNRETRPMISKIKKLLNPGGVVVLEEPDFTSAKFLNDPEDDACLRVNSAICKMFVELNLNPAYGLTLPQELQAEGFEVSEIRSNLHFAPGLSPVAKVMAESTAALAEKYVATGEASSEDIDRYIAHSKDKTHWSVYYSTISVIARWPA